MTQLANLGDNIWFIDDGTHGYMTHDKKLVRRIAIILYLSEEITWEEFNYLTNDTKGKSGSDATTLSTI